MASNYIPQELTNQLRNSGQADSIHGLIRSRTLLEKKSGGMTSAAQKVYYTELCILPHSRTQEVA